MSSAIDLDANDPVNVPSPANDQPIFLGYTTAQVQRAAAYAFATLAGLGAVAVAGGIYFSVLSGIAAPGAALSLVIVAGGCIYFAPGIRDIARAGPAAPSLRNRFDAVFNHPKMTFLSMCSTFKGTERQQLVDQHLISQAHFDKLNDLDVRATQHATHSFRHQYRHTLTLYANKSADFKALLALDAEYKQFVDGQVVQRPNPPAVDLTPILADRADPQARIAPYVEARVQRAVYSVFAVLSGLATAIFVAGTYFGAFSFIVGSEFIIPLALLTGAFVWWAYQVVDYKDPAIKQTLRDQSTNTSFIDMYRKYGLSNLLEAQVFSVAELKQKFNAEVQKPETTFWNVLRRYDQEELCVAGIISREHLAVLNSLYRQARPLNATLYSKTKSHSVAGTFAKEPIAFRAIDALDREYKRILGRLLQIQ